mmetsp:Transcript_43796/g.70398  ORF Transcript_43796/g.70398 Transcript_43796/m.70398 type:complete len:262 (+) Transcript_43796:27-812(+)
MVFVMITACWLLAIPTTEASFKDHKPRRGVKRDSESRKLEIPREDKFERRERLLRERRRKENAENRLKNLAKKRNPETFYYGILSHRKDRVTGKVHRIHRQNRTEVLQKLYQLRHTLQEARAKEELNIEMKRGSLHYAVRTYPGVQATHTIFVQPGENIKKLRREYVAWDPQASTGVKERQSTDSSYKKLAGSMRKLKALSHRLVKVDTKIKLMTQVHKKVRINGTVRYQFFGKPLSEKEKRKRGIANKRLFGIKRIVAEL